MLKIKYLFDAQDEDKEDIREIVNQISDFQHYLLFLGVKSLIGKVKLKNLEHVNFLFVNYSISEKIEWTNKSVIKVKKKDLEEKYYRVIYESCIDNEWRIQESDWQEWYI